MDLSTLDEADLFPLAGLMLVSGRYRLTVPGEETIFELGRLAAGGVHDPQVQPFRNKWTAGSPLQTGRNVVTHLYKQLGTSTPQEWNLPFAVIHGEKLIGVQVLHGKDFSELREVRTGSWLGLAHQGKGHGTAMRRIVLQFAFEYLKAEQALSMAFADNPASNAVSRKVGYTLDGTEPRTRMGGRRPIQRYVLTAEQWAFVDKLGVEVHGFTNDVLELLAPTR